jgi:hypothetical protein
VRGALFALYGLIVLKAQLGSVGYMLSLLGVLGIYWLVAGIVMLLTPGKRSVVVDETGIEMLLENRPFSKPECVLLARDEIVHVSMTELLHGRFIEIAMKNQEVFHLAASYYCDLDEFIGHCKRFELPIKDNPPESLRHVKELPCLEPFDPLSRLAYRAIGIHIFKKAASLKPIQRLRYLLKTRRNTLIAAVAWAVSVLPLLFLGVCCAYPYFAVMIHLDKPEDEASADLWSGLAFLLPAGLFLIWLPLVISTRSLVTSYSLLLFMVYYGPKSSKA